MSEVVKERQSFVVFPLGTRRYALLTTDVVELSHTGFVQTFLHTTPGLLGVLVRRGEVLPVWDLAPVLLGPGGVERRYWLITRRNATAEEATAIPVSGECEMVHGEMQPPPEDCAPYVRGVLLLDGNPIEVLDLQRFPRLSKEREER